MAHRARNHDSTRKSDKKYYVGKTQTCVRNVKPSIRDLQSTKSASTKKYASSREALFAEYRAHHPLCKLKAG